MCRAFGAGGARPSRSRSPAFRFRVSFGLVVSLCRGPASLQVRLAPVPAYTHAHSFYACRTSAIMTKYTQLDF